MTTFVFSQNGFTQKVGVSEKTMNMLKEAIRKAFTVAIVDDLAEQIIKGSPEIYDIDAVKQPIEIDFEIVAIQPSVRVTSI
jgi:hypothetical protein